MSIETEITRIKTNIASAYTKAEEKGATLPEVQNSANLASTIESITGGEEEWQPQPDWWDIDKILEEDTEDYPGKMIVLLLANRDTQTITNMYGSAKIKMSDGTEYTSANITHTWDKSYDKECSLGYKTRYMILYYSSSTPANTPYDGTTVFPSALYIIYKDISKLTHSNSSPFRNQVFLECIKSNCDIDFANISPQIFYNCKSLKKIDFSFIYNGTTLEGSGSSAFRGCLQLNKMEKIRMTANNANILNLCFGDAQFKYIDFSLWGIDTSSIKNISSTFNSYVVKIKKLDCTNITNCNSAFSNASALYEIGEISNIKISGLDFSKCTLLNHDTLIRILNALYDYSADTENTYTITLGLTNLAKLTEEEIAIGTNKGWTIS